jgi:small-conductance mechanosensitive channel
LILGVEIKEFFLIIATTFTILGTAFFASWSNLSNISSGIILFSNYDIKIGDRIRIGSEEEKIEGIIHDMKLFYIEIKTLEDELVLFPNNIVLHKSITILKH